MVPLSCQLAFDLVSSIRAKGAPCLVRPRPNGGYALAWLIIYGVHETGDCRRQFDARQKYKMKTRRNSKRIADAFFRGSFTWSNRA